MKVKPMGMLLMMLAGWINRHQQDVIVHLKAENEMLRERLGTAIQRIRVSLVQDQTPDARSSRWARANTNFALPDDPVLWIRAVV